MPWGEWGEGGGHEPVSLLERDRQSGFGPVQTPSYKQHKLCPELSQGNIQFDFYCSSKLQDTPHLTRPNEIKNSTFSTIWGHRRLPSVTTKYTTFHRRLRNLTAVQLTPYGWARLALNHITLMWHKILNVTYICKSFAGNPRAIFRPLRAIWQDIYRKLTFSVAARRLVCCAVYCAVLELVVRFIVQYWN